MLRSSSKMITRARSVRKLGKAPFKFKFDIIIESVEKLAASGEVVVVLDTQRKVECTAPIRIDRNNRRAVFNEKLSTEIALFKAKPTDKKFQDKVVKLAVKSGTIDGKTLTKIHLNVAEYAEVPSGSKRVSAALLNGGVLIATIQSQFLCMGKAVGVSRRSESPSQSSTDEEEGLNDEELDVASFSSGPESSEKSFRSRLKLAHASTRKSTQRERRSEDDFGLEKLRRENGRLRKAVEDAEKGVVNPQEEIETMKGEIKDIKRQLSEEPAYKDVLKELTEAKMALAILNMEKEMLEFQILQEKRRRRTG